MPTHRKSWVSEESCLLRRLPSLAGYKPPPPPQTLLCVPSPCVWACLCTHVPRLPVPASPHGYLRHLAPGLACACLSPLPSSRLAICRDLESAKVSELKQCYLRKYLKTIFPQIAKNFTTPMWAAGRGRAGCGGVRGASCPLEKPHCCRVPDRHARRSPRLGCGVCESVTPTTVSAPCPVSILRDLFFFHCAHRVTWYGYLGG